MSALLYTFHRELLCLNVVDCKVENGLHLKEIASEYCGGIPVGELSVIHNGHLISEESKLHLQAGDVCYATLRLLGGKGGFGSMLRALGAQIEKTTNREACRDLSGRRMRDINDEKKIAEWVSNQAEREREKERQKQERMERKRRIPNHRFDDATYTKHIQENSERIEDALQQGLKAAGSSMSMGSSTSTEKTAVKRIHSDESSTSTGSKKSRMWLGVDDLDSDEYEDDYAASESNSGTPSTCPSTVPSCSSTQVEPSTSNESLHNRWCMDTGGDTTTHPKTLEAQANNDELGRGDQTKVVQEETALSQTASQAKVQSKENQGEDAGNMSQEKVEFCLEDYTSAEQLESMGLERLKEELMVRGLKCGGTIQQRAQRLYATKGVPLDQLDPSFFAKTTGSKKSNRKN